MSTDLHQAAALGDTDAVEAAIAAGADAGRADAALGLTPLMLAARGGHTAVIAQLLDAGAAVDGPGRDGLTPLMLAALADQPAATAALLDAGADPERASDAGARAVHMAATVSALRALRVLEERGAAIFGADARGLSIAAYAEHRQQPAVLRYIEAARLRGRYRELRQMLSDTRLVARLLGEPPAPSALRAAEAAERAAAEPITVLPPSGPRSAPPVAAMREMTAALGPVSPEVFESLLLDHQDFLRTGGESAPCRWHSFTDEGLVFALCAGPAGLRGRQASLHLRDLSQLDGLRAVLRRADLIGVVAEGIRFEGADLSRSVLTDSDLRGASFEDAALVRADLSRADLQGASFVGADLTLADLEGCDLRGADLRGATLVGTRLGGADLRGAIR